MYLERERLVRRWVGIVLAIAAANPAAAETDPITIEEVLVVTTRVSQPIDEIPAAVSVIGRDDVQLGRQQLGLDEALNRVPGVFAQNRYNFAQDLRLAVRGFGARANFGIRGLKVYVDGIPETTADGQSGVDAIDLGAVERIEITRGPSSALYGASSGGVLHLFTEDGGEEGRLSASILGGEDGYRKYQVKAGGRAGAVDYFASVSDLTYDGYRDNARVEATQFNGKLNYQMDNADLTVVVGAVDSPKAEDAGGITAAQVAAEPSQAQPRNLSSNSDEEVEQQKIGWVYNRTFDAGFELTVRNYYVWRDFGAFLPIGSHIPFVADDGVVEFDRFFYGGGMQLHFPGTLFGRENRLVVGFDIDQQEDDRQRYINNAGVRGALSFDQIEEAETYGVYLRNELKVTDTLAFILGGRYDDVELSVDDKFIANGDQSSTLDFDEFSPMAGIVWQMSDLTNVYVNYATSFETPTFTELASPARSLSVNLGGFNDVTAQEATSYELGLRGRYLNDRLYIDAAIYTMDVEDEIASVSNIGNRSFFDNADTERKGFELTAIASLSERFELSLAYTRARYEFDKFDSSPGLVGNDLPGLPETQYFAELAYRHENGFYAIADVLYADDFQINNANTLMNEDSTVWNFRLGYRGDEGRWRVSPYVGIHNVTDEDYMSNVRINGFGGRVFEPGPERYFYAGITIDFHP